MRKRLTVLSILEAQPKHETSNPNGYDAVIKEISDTIGKASSADSTNHTLLRATSLTHMEEELRSYADSHPDSRPSIVQIIGHASSGQLSCGYTWTGKYRTVTRHSYPDKACHCLDGNPREYMVLKDVFKNKVMDEVEEIWLLGCSLGSKSDLLDANIGRAMIFDVAQMWSRPVVAPKGTVQAGDFDAAGGLYIHRCESGRAIVKVDGARVIESGQEVPAVESTMFEIRSEHELVFEHLVSAPAFGIRDLAVAQRQVNSILENGSANKVPVLISPSVGQVLTNTFRHRINMTSPPLAMEEVRFVVLWQNRKWIADLIINCQMLRLRPTRPLLGEGQREYYFIAAAGEKDKARQSLSSLLAPTFEAKHS
jgi:hypothetical protein